MINDAAVNNQYFSCPTDVPLLHEGEDAGQKYRLEISSRTELFKAFILQTDGVWQNVPIRLKGFDVNSTEHQAFFSQNQSFIKVKIKQESGKETLLKVSLKSHAILLKSDSQEDSECQEIAIAQQLIREELLTNRDFAQELSYYVPLQASCWMYSSKPLLEKVEEFLNSPDKLLVLEGSFGAGKTFFSKMLALNSSSPFKNYLIVPISLAIADSYHEVLKEGLAKYQLEIEKIPKNRKVLWLFDDYEYIKEPKNFHITYGLQAWENAKAIFFYCNDINHPEYKSSFALENKNYRYLWLTRFKEEQIREYLSKFLKQRNPSNWNLQKYMDTIKHYNLSELVSNPFYLKIFAIVMPFIPPTKFHLGVAKKYLLEHYLCWLGQRASNHLKHIPNAPNIKPLDFVKFGMDVGNAMGRYLRKNREKDWLDGKQFWFCNQGNEKEFFDSFFTRPNHDFLRNELLVQKGDKWGFENHEVYLYFEHLVHIWDVEGKLKVILERLIDID